MSSPNDISILHHEVLTLHEVAAYLRVSRVTVWRWCQQGIIPAFQVGRYWRVRRKDLLQHIEQLQPSPQKHNHQAETEANSNYSSLTQAMEETSVEEVELAEGSSGNDSHSRHGNTGL